MFAEEEEEARAKALAVWRSKHSSGSLDRLRLAEWKDEDGGEPDSQGGGM